MCIAVMKRDTRTMAARVFSIGKWQVSRRVDEKQRSYPTNFSVSSIAVGLFIVIAACNGRKKGARCVLVVFVACRPFRARTPRRLSIESKRWVGRSGRRQPPSEWASSREPLERVKRQREPRPLIIPLPRGHYRAAPG